MNVINFQIDKKRNNFSKNRQKTKQFLLPSLNIMLKEERHKKSNMPYQYQYEIYNLNKNKQIKNINNQFKNQKNKIKNKSNEHHQVFRNHKPYSGNPSIKCNSNIVEENKPQMGNNNQMNFEREILTANPSLVASKIGFNNKYEDSSQSLCVNGCFLNNKNPNIILTKNKSNIINNNIFNYNNNSDLNKYKENYRENISAKYQYNQENKNRIYKKMMGVSKSSPRFSSLGMISSPYEIQKQKENIDYKNNLKVIMSYNNDNNFYNNMIKMKNGHNMNFIDYKNFNEYNKYLTKEKNKQFNLGNIYNSGNSNSNLNTQNMLIKAAEKVKLQLVQKHLNLKSASIINISNPIHGEYPNNNNIKIIKNKSKHSLNSSLNAHKDMNILGGLNNTAFSTISPYSNNLSINQIQKNLNDINSNNNSSNKPKISKCFISYAYNEHPNLEHRQEMEDFHCIKQALGKNPYISYFSIFDGHGGKDVSSYLSLNFHRVLIKEINSIIFNSNDDENVKNIMSAIKNAFEKIDQEILKNNNFSNDVGSTATIIVIYCNENEINEKKVYSRTLICANVGDSNGFLINKNYIKLITKGHKCEDPSEVKRIKEQGGIVFQGRIFGKLILTRTLGDKEMKKYGVVPIPDFFCKKISNDDLFVIIGSDGVWDIIEENEIYKIGIEKGLSSEEFSKKLINISKERDTRDNANCIVIKLNKNI